MITTTIDHAGSVSAAALKVAGILRRATTPVGSYYSDMLDGYVDSVLSLRCAIRRAKAAGEAAVEIGEAEQYDCDLSELDIFTR